jgi:hypothetical protein
MQTERHMIAPGGSDKTSSCSRTLSITHGRPMRAWKLYYFPICGARTDKISPHAGFDGGVKKYFYTQKRLSSLGEG